MAYRRSHYRKGHWRQTKNGIVWISPTHVSGHEFNPNSLGNPYGRYSGSLPNLFITANPIAPVRPTNIPSTNVSKTLNPYSFHITPEQYEEKYSEAKKLFAMAKSSDDYLYVEAFFLGLANYKNSQFYIDLCRKHYKTYLHYEIKDAISKEKKKPFQDTSSEYTYLQGKPSNNSALTKKSRIISTTVPNKAHAQKTPSVNSSKGALNEPPESRIQDQSSSSSKNALNEPSKSKIQDQSSFYYFFLCLALFVLLLLLLAMPVVINHLL